MPFFFIAKKKLMADGEEEDQIMAWVTVPEREKKQPWGGVNSRINVVNGKKTH